MSVYNHILIAQKVYAIKIIQKLHQQTSKILIFKKFDRSVLL